MNSRITIKPLEGPVRNTADFWLSSFQKTAKN